MVRWWTSVGISYRFDGLVKVITGIRRCGKSYLLKNIYRDYLIENGVKEEQIVVSRIVTGADRIKFHCNILGESWGWRKTDSDLFSILEKGADIIQESARILCSIPPCKIFKTTPFVYIEWMLKSLRGCFEIRISRCFDTAT